jgi:biotin carboxyl carrier protein
MTISIPVGPVAAQAAQAAEEYDWDAENGFSLGGELPEWRLVVAPARGIFHAMPLASENTGGTELGHIEARHDRQPIIAPWRGSVIEWLVQDGDPVGLGQPVARLLPDDAEIDVPAGTPIDVAS